MAERNSLAVYLYEDRDTVEVEFSEGMSVALAIEMLEFALISLKMNNGEWS